MMSTPKAIAAEAPDTVMSLRPMIRDDRDPAAIWIIAPVAATKMAGTPTTPMKVNSISPSVHSFCD